MSLRPLAIIGTGGMGREVLELLQALERAGGQPRYEVLGFLTCRADEHGSRVCGLPVLGAEDWLAAHPGTLAVCAIGDPRGRRRVVEKLGPRGVEFATLVDPTVRLGPNVAVGPGCILCNGAVLTTQVVLGAHVIVNLHATLSHDTQADDFVTVGPGARLTGGVRVGEAAELGAGSVVIPRKTIGRGALVGAGAVVVDDVAADTVVAGNPARVLRTLAPDSQTSPQADGHGS